MNKYNLGQIVYVLDRNFDEPMPRIIGCKVIGMELNIDDVVTYKILFNMETNRRTTLPSEMIFENYTEAKKAVIDFCNNEVAKLKRNIEIIENQLEVK